MVDWPPTLTVFKVDLKIAADDTRNDVELQQVLDAAVSYVERVRPDLNYDADPLSELPEPTADHVLGTLRLARRWNERRKSPDGLVSLGEMGSGRVPAFDPDIEKMLGIGRFAPARFA